MKVNFSAHGTRYHFMPLLLLFVIVGVIYGGVMTHDFLPNWDDNEYVIANSAIRGFSLANLKAAFSRFFVGNYSPLQIMSYMADYTLWGLKPGGFLLTNVILHFLNGMLFYSILLRIDGERVTAFIASFLFLCHPVQVESVAWVSQRKNVLAMFFFLIAVWCYLRYRADKSGRSVGLFYGGSFLSFTAALLSKTVTVFLPLVLLLYDLCYDTREPFRKRLTDKIPFLGAAAAVALLALNSQSMEAGGGRVGYHGSGPVDTLLTMVTVFVRYLFMIIWPVGLSAAYAPEIRTGLDGAVAGSALILAVAGAGGVYLFRTQRRLFFWYALFWIGLLPVSQIIPIVTLMNDRYLYFPMLGAAPLITGGALLLVNKVRQEWRRRATVLCCLLLASLPVLSWSQTRVWNNSLTLWSDATRKEPQSMLAWLHYGAALESSGNSGEAYTAYRRAISLKPKTINQGDMLYYADALGCLGSLTLRVNPMEATNWFTQSLAADPRNRNALKGMAIMYTMTNRPEAGRLYLEKLTAAYPEEEEGLLLLAENRSVARDFAQAERAFKRALAINPASPSAFRGLGALAVKKGDLATAREWYRKALAAGGEKGEIEYDLAGVETVAGRLDEALKHLEQALTSGFKDNGRIAGNRTLAPLREHPEFHTLMARYSGAGSSR